MAFIQLFLVLGFALAWGAVELYCLRLDKKEAEAAAKEGGRQ